MLIGVSVVLGLILINGVLAMSEPLSLTLMVIGVTFVALVVGELVPKHVALTSPERIASLVAQPMHVLARIGHPLVVVLTASTDALLHLLRVPQVKEPGPSLEECKVLIKQATAQGVFEKRIDRVLITRREAKS